MTVRFSHAALTRHCVVGRGMDVSYQLRCRYASPTQRARSYLHPSCPRLGALAADSVLWRKPPHMQQGPLSRRKNQSRLEAAISDPSVPKKEVHLDLAVCLRRRTTGHGDGRILVGWISRATRQFDIGLQTLFLQRAMVARYPCLIQCRVCMWQADIP